jgi:hypothetical protein
MSDYQVTPDTDPQVLSEMVARHVDRFIPTMVPGHSYTLESMCGRAFWDRMTPSQRRAAGRSMTFLVSSGRFDLAYADTGRRPTKQYQLK